MKILMKLRVAVLLVGCLLNANMSTLAHAAAVSPADADRTYRETNDVLYYEKTCGKTAAASAAAAAAGGGGCGTNADNDKANEQQIWDFLVTKFEGSGYTQDEAEKAAAGVMGNWQQESSLNSYVKGGNGCEGYAATGIAQWCGGRVGKLYDYANSQGQSADCLGTQLNFMWSEIETGYRDLVPAMKGQDPSSAAHIFDLGGNGASYGYESGADVDKRQADANQIYTQFTGKSSGASTTTPASSTQNLSSTTSSSSSSFACTGSAAAAADDGECKNPFRDLQKSTVSRIDGGYDYGGPSGSGPVYAACPATIVSVAGPGSSGWPGGGSGNNGWYIKYQMTSGKAKDLYMYIAEDCPAAVKAGDKVDTNQPICNYKDAGTELETGWASSGGGTGYVDWSDYPQHDNNWASNSGVDIDKFFQTLGLPHDNINEGPSTGQPPASWPKWTTDASTPTTAKDL